MREKSPRLVRALALAAGIGAALAVIVGLIFRWSAIAIWMTAALCLVFSVQGSGPGGLQQNQHHKFNNLDAINAIVDKHQESRKGRNWDALFFVTMGVAVLAVGYGIRYFVA